MYTVYLILKIQSDQGRHSTKKSNLRFCYNNADPFKTITQDPEQFIQQNANQATFLANFWERW